MPDLPKGAWRPAGPLRIGEHDVLPASNELRGPAGLVRVRPLLMDILLRLAAQPGEVVARETLLAEVWPRRMVNDEVLSRTIAELRTALGDEAREPRYIETIPKSGYRLVAPVEPLAASVVTAPIARPPVQSSRPWLAGLAILVVAGLAALAFFRPAPPEPAPATLAESVAAAQPFTADKTLEVAPRFSPDGTRVAFTVLEGSESHLVVQPVDGGSRLVIRDAGVLRHSPVFLPDGKRLAYWRAKGEDCAIVERDLETGTERSLTDCALRPRARFDLSPDGKRLALTGHTRPQFPAGIVLVDVASGQASILTSPEPGSGEDINPRFSPDGRRLVFFRGTASHRRAWIATVDDPASAKPASDLEGLTYGAAWLGPEGPLLVAADWLGFRALTTLDLATGQAKLLGGRGARFPDASVRGDLVFENAQYQANLFLVEPGKAAAPAERWPSTRYTNQPAFSPDGRQVAFVSNRDGTEGLYVAPVDGEPVRLPLPATHRYIRAHWAPDGRALYAVRIAIETARPAPQHAVRIRLPDGAVEVLEHLGTAVNAVLPSADGQWLFVGELSGHALRLMRAKTGGTQAPERLPLPLVAEAQLNAAHLVYTLPDLRGATICRLATLACERLDIGLGEEHRFDWLLTDRSIYYPVRVEGGRGLARYDLATRRLAETRDFGPTAAGLAIGASPDETRILVAREAPPSIDLMIARARRR